MQTKEIFSGIVTASHFYGDGSNLTNIDPTPAGANTQIQYNNNGAFGASGSLTFDGSMLEVAGIISATSSPSGTEGLRKVFASTSSPSGGADGDLWLKYDTSPVTSYLPSNWWYSNWKYRSSKFNNTSYKYICDCW